MSKNSKNGYYKYYNAEGKSCRIKIYVDKIKLPDTGILLKYKGPEDIFWNYHVPNKHFGNVFEIIKYLSKNTEVDGTIYKVYINNQL